jgi:hypothetical protein
MASLKDNSTLAEGPSSFLKSSSSLPKRHTLNYDAGSPTAILSEIRGFRYAEFQDFMFARPDRSLEVTSIPGMQLIECLLF